MSEGIHTTVDIAAPPSRVWQVLTAFERFGEWNPLVVRLSGEAERGAALRMTVRIWGRKVPADATVLACEPGRELRWRGPRSSLLGRLFSGEHFFLLERRGEGTHLEHGENFTGLMVPLLWRAIGPALHESFERMNDALKERVEKSDV
jgi:hypothetical protein